MVKTVEVTLGLGSNSGDRKSHLDQAISMLNRYISSVKQSSFIETKAVDCHPHACSFLNAAVVGSTHLSPADLLTVCLDIECQMGRPQQHSYHDDRIIDIDILLFGRQHIQTRTLQIPHPYLSIRQFVLAPLMEIAPDWKIPLENKCIADCYKELNVERDRGKNGAF